MEPRDQRGSTLSVHRAFRVHFGTSGGPGWRHHRDGQRFVVPRPEQLTEDDFGSVARAVCGRKNGDHRTDS